MIITSNLWFSRLLLAILAFSSVLHGYDLSKRLAPRGALGVALDYPFATAWPPGTDSQVSRNWMWSSRITFVKDVSNITDNQLWQIASDAYDEIKTDMVQYKIGDRNRPGALTVLAFGKELILASSQKGPASFTYRYPDSPVLESLMLCQAVWKDNGPIDRSPETPKHRTEGKCGEQMTAQLYYSTHTAPLSTQKARVVTVKGVRNGNRDSPATHADPCGSPEEARRDIWGCSLFVVDQGLTPVPTTLDKAPYTLSTLAGGPSVIDQIQICSAVRITSTKDVL